MRQWKGSRSFPDSCGWRQHQELRRGDPEGKDHAAVGGAVVQEEEEFEGPATRTMPPAAVKVSVYAWSPIPPRRFTAPVGLAGNAHRSTTATAPAQTHLLGLSCEAGGNLARADEARVVQEGEGKVGLLPWGSLQRRLAAQRRV